MARTLEILSRLVAFDSVSARPNLDLVGYVQDLLTACGAQVTRLADPGGHKAGLFARIGPPGAGVLLSGHSDVVPAQDQGWSRPPFALTDEGARLYGRGTTDMKGFVAAMLAAAEAAARLPLKQPLCLALSWDEEVGCLGIRHMIDALIPAIGRPRACIVGEPTNMQVAIGHKGKAAFRATCRGVGGHSALAPSLVNALHLAGDMLAGLRALQDWLAQHGARDDAYDIPHATVHVGVLSGGTALNIVPDRAELLFELRHLAADDPADLAARIAAVAQRVTDSHRAQHPGTEAIGITLVQENAYPGLDTAPDAQVVQMACALAGSDARTKVAFGTEAGFFDALGIPTVVCGPGSMAGQGHKPDEYITRSQLAACDAMLARLVDTLA